MGTQIFVIHGGLSREREKPLEALKALDHHRNIPQRPYGREECIIFDALWADPQDEDGIQVGGRGDDTIKWGPDVTSQFLQGTGLELIVRSHQVPAGRRGFGLHHDSKVSSAAWRKARDTRARRPERMLRPAVQFPSQTPVPDPWPHPSRR